MRYDNSNQNLSDEQLLEDAGCTAELDTHHWMPKELPACVFTLSSDVCEE